MPIIKEDSSSLFIVEDVRKKNDADYLLQCLREDKVVLIRSCSSSDADALIHQVAKRLGLLDSLKLQATFASSLGTRKNIGQYYMSVNERQDYNVVPPHSEGSSFATLQLASFFCYENTTDGGETVLMNVDGLSPLFADLRELGVRAKFDGTPTAADIAQARSMFRVDLRNGALKDDDIVLNEISVSSKLKLYEVLGRPVKSHSLITEDLRYVYWDSICTTDFDVLKFMETFLRREQLFKEPPNYTDISEIDWGPARRSVHSDIDFDKLFLRKITLKLAPGDFILANNFNWVHSVNNWTPGSGIRTVAAAFA
ncbi:hypothetical protein [Microbulbifer sp. TYP-18]|uniref:hypothetical protein n=1 Tax=Microbulbifer sp. TYP-18 TaxID=3230024 RepID=UPI0034C6C6E5